MVAASVVTNTIFSAAYFQGFGVLILPIERTFGWDRWVISAAMSLRQLESGIVSPAVGFLLDRFSARKLIFWSAVISGVGFIGLGFTTGIVTFFLFFVVISLGASGISHAVTWPVIISRWFRRNRGLATGLAVTGPDLRLASRHTEHADRGGVRLARRSVRLRHLDLGRRSRCSACWCATGRSPTACGPMATRRRRAPPRNTLPAHRAAESDAGLTLHAVFRTKEFWLFTSYLSGTFAVNSAVQGHMIPYFQQDIGLTAAWAAVVMSMVFIISGIGRIGGGYLLDRMDYRLVLAVVAAMMGFRLLYLQVVAVKTVWATLPFALMFGVSFGCLVPMRGAVGSIMFGTRTIGGILGLLQGGPIAAGVIGPLVMGIDLRPERELLRRHLGTHRHQRFHDAAVPGHGLARRAGQAHWPVAGRLLKKTHMLRCARPPRVDVLPMYASARRFLAAPRLWIFLSSLQDILRRVSRVRPFSQPPCRR